MPQKDAGPRMLPPMSDPMLKNAIPAANDAAVPPDDPPGVRARSQGLWDVPYMSLKAWASMSSSGTLVAPSRIAPASRSRRTATACAGAFEALSGGIPQVHG